MKSNHRWGYSQSRAFTHNLRSSGWWLQLLSLSLFLRDNEGALVTTIRTTLTCPTIIQSVVRSGCDGCSLLSLVLFCLYCLMWHQVRTSRPKYVEEAITLRQTFSVESISWLSPSRIAPIRKTIIEVKSTLQLQLHLVVVGLIIKGNYITSSVSNRTMWSRYA